VGHAQAPGERFAGSPAGHVAVITRGGEEGLVQVAGPDGRFSVPQAVGPAQFIAVGARGDVLVVGHKRVERPTAGDEGLDVEFELWASFRPRGGPVGPPVLLGVSRAIGEDWPALGVDASGMAAVLWTADADPEPLMASVRDPARGWLPAQALGGGSAFRPSLSVTSGGLMTAAWRQNRPPRPNDTQVAVATRAPGAAAFGASTVVAGVQRSAGEPVVASNDRGDAVVAWTETHPRKPRRRFDIPTGFTVHGSFRRAGGRFSRPVRLSEIEAANPAVSVADSGRMVMAWPGDEHVEARVRSAGGVLRPARRVSHDRDENSGVAVVAAGRGAVAWLDRDPGVSFLRVARATADGRFARARTLARARDMLDPPAFLLGPPGLRVVRGFGRPRGTPLRWQAVPRP
jgi:hypothetical protein